MFPDFRKSIALGRFPGFVLLSFWQEQHIDEAENGALMELYREREKKYQEQVNHMLDQYKVE
jgi:hypothetical protein